MKILIFLFSLISLNAFGNYYYSIEFQDRSFYEGEIFKKNTVTIDSTWLPNGPGQIFYKDKSTYVGRWDEGMRNIKGKMNYFDGSYYNGIWDYDKRIGKGTYSLVNGKKLTGEFNFGYFGWGIYKISKINDLWYFLSFWYFKYIKGEHFNIQNEDKKYFQHVINTKVLNFFKKGVKFPH